MAETETPFALIQDTEPAVILQSCIDHTLKGAFCVISDCTFETFSYVVPGLLL